MLHRKTSTKILLGAAPAFLLFGLAWATMAFAFTHEDAAAALLSAMLWFCLAAYIGGIVARVCARTTIDHLELERVTVVFGDGTPMLDVLAQMREELASLRVPLDVGYEILTVKEFLADSEFTDEDIERLSMQPGQIVAVRRTPSRGIDAIVGTPQDARVDLSPQAERHEGAGGG